MLISLLGLWVRASWAHGDDPVAVTDLSLVPLGNDDVGLEVPTHRRPNAGSEGPRSHVFSVDLMSGNTVFARPAVSPVWWSSGRSTVLLVFKSS